MYDILKFDFKDLDKEDSFFSVYTKTTSREYLNEVKTEMISALQKIEENLSSDCINFEVISGGYIENLKFLSEDEKQKLNNNEIVKSVYCSFYSLLF